MVALVTHSFGVVLFINMRTLRDFPLRSVPGNFLFWTEFRGLLFRLWFYLFPVWVLLFYFHFGDLVLILFLLGFQFDSALFPIYFGLNCGL